MQGESNTTFVGGVVCMMCGIALSFLYEGQWPILGLVLVVCILTVVVYYFLRIPYLLMVCVGLLLCALGLVRADITQIANHYNELDSRIDTHVTLQGVITEESDVRDYNTRLTIYIPQYNTKVLARVAFYPEYQYGTKVSLSGILELPERFEGDTGRIFDYPNYLLKDNIRYIIQYPVITPLAYNQGNPIKSALLSLKQSLLAHITRIFPEPHGSLLGGLLLGAKSSMGERLLDDFRTTGVIHIVVLSGFNITIVAEAIMRVLAFAGVTASAIFGSIGILFFAIMTGASSTVVRASLMAFLVIIARVSGNYSAVTRMLFATAFIMLMVNPMLLLYDPGFQLSFLATLGLIVLSPKVGYYLRVIPSRYVDLRGLAAATIATQIMVLPLILYSMGTFPTYAPLVNLLILAGVPATMLFGFVAALASYVSVTIALPFVALGYILLHYDLVVVQLFAQLPFASFTVPPFSFTWVIISYLVYGGVYIYTAYAHQAPTTQADTHHVR